MGIGLQKRHTITDKEIIRKIIKALLTNGMSRGKTATGLCYTSNKEMVIIKDKLDAADFVETDIYKNASKEYVRLEGIFEQQLLSIIGHCRLKTKGTELNNDNNHPIRYENVVGIHNGMIINDDIQFEKHRDILHRKAQVDSEVIFALINHFAKTTESIPKGIQDACRSLVGRYACAMVHNCQPHILWLFRSVDPCTIYHFKDVGIIIFASLPAFIIDAVSEHNLGPYSEIPLDPNEGIGIDLYRHKYQRFDLKT